jgi:hypothetical protein
VGIYTLLHGLYKAKIASRHAESHFVTDFCKRPLISVTWVDAMGIAAGLVFTGFECAGSIVKLNRVLYATNSICLRDSLYMNVGHLFMLLIFVIFLHCL